MTQGRGCCHMPVACLPRELMTGYAGHNAVLRDNQKAPAHAGVFDYRLENFLSLIVTMLNDGAFLRFMPEKRKRIVSGDSPCFNPETVANIFGMQAFYSTLFLQSA